MPAYSALGYGACVPGDDGAEGEGMETARVFFGLGAAVSVPLTLDWQRTYPRTTTCFTVLYGLLAIGPYMADRWAWATLTTAVVITAATAFLLRTTPTPPAGFTLTFPISFGRPSWRHTVGTVLVLLGAAWVTQLAIARGGTAGLRFLTSDTVVIFFSAFLIALYGGGPLARAMTGKIRQQILNLPDSSSERQAAVDLMNGGQRIGVLERGLLFTFFAAGQPEAAALALAAKSLARIPAADHSKLASEYFLIGTLTSVITALVLSMAARTAVGMSAL